MSQSAKDQKHIRKLQKQESELKSALDGQIGDDAVLNGTLRNVQATLRKLTGRQSET